MDPQANLEEQRQLSHENLNSEHKEWEPDNMAQVWENRATRLAELVQAMDEWRKNGGADPYKVKQDGK